MVEEALVKWLIERVEERFGHLTIVKHGFGVDVYSGVSWFLAASLKLSKNDAVWVSYGSGKGGDIANYAGWHAASIIDIADPELLQTIVSIMDAALAYYDHTPTVTSDFFSRQIISESG